MADDYYKTLGVSREASQADIQKAYRELARKYHPDMNPDDPSATKRFQQIQGAFDVLNNPEKRELYDRYGSSFETMGAGGPSAQGGGAWGPGSTGAGGGFNFQDVDLEQFLHERFGGGEGQGGQPGFADLFSQFRRASSRGGAGRGRKGTDATAEVEIPFATSVTGGEVQLAIQRQAGSPETIVVKIPPGIENGKKIRLRGQGEPARGRGGAPSGPGDLLLTVHVAAHPFFSRRGNNLYVRLPVTLGEAAAGSTVEVPTPKGTVAVHIPPSTSSGQKLRIKGQGVPLKNGTAGDLFAEVEIVLPKLSEADREALRRVDERYPLHPRQNLRW